MTKFFKLSAAALLALGLAACSSAPAEEKPAEETAAEETATETTEEAAEDVQGLYTVTNKTGEKITELYLYETGSADKGENYAEKGLDDGASVTIDKGTFSAKDAEGIAYTVEFKTESGYTSAAFDHLHVETVSMNILPEADVESAATPWEWAH